MKWPRTRTQAPTSHAASSSLAPSQATAGRLPVRSPSVSLRNEPPSRLERTSRSRTSSTRSMSWPSSSSRTNMRKTLDASPDGPGLSWRRMRTALITGGTGGLGVAVVEAFIAAGWRVVVPWAVQPEREGLELVPADLTDPDEVARAVRAATAEPDAPLGAVVNLVGGFAAGERVADAPWQDFERLLMLNLKPTYEVVHAALPALAAAGGGAVVCVSARAATHPFAGAAGYCASKAAVLTFAQVVALEGSEDGIRCNAILPRKIDTPANRAANPDDPDVGTAPADVARTILFLCGDESGAVTGATIPV